MREPAPAAMLSSMVRRRVLAFLHYVRIRRWRVAWELLRRGFRD